MNRIFKVKFNSSLNIVQVVSELATNAIGTHKSINTKKTNKNYGIKIFAYSLLYFGLSGISFAAVNEGIVVNGSKTDVITSSTSGASLINIAKPNEKGLSHNKYSDFNVSKGGAVFNNSSQDTTTHIVGNIKGNENLAGQSASVILNEVNGINSSHLNGALEVAGTKASIIISNQNGISVDGVSVINAAALSLTTGQLVDTDNLLFDVTKGEVTVQGDGLNTSGLDKFDIVSKVIKINSSIMSKTVDQQAGAGITDIKLIAGSNRYDYTNDSVSATSDVITNGGYGINIGGDALGSIYGNYVTLISSDSGVGVRQQGIISSPNDILITSNGKVEFIANSASQTSAKNIAVHAKDGGNIDNVKANEKVLLTNQNGTLKINNIKANDINANSNDTISVKGLSATNVDIYGKQLVRIEADTAQNINSISASNITIKSDNATGIYGGIKADDKIAIQTESLNIRSAVIDGNQVKIDANNDIIIDGQIVVKDAQGNIIDGATAVVSSNPDDYNAIIIKDAKGSICSNCVLSSTAAIFGDNISITTNGQFNNSKGAIESKNATIKARRVTNDGIIINKEQLTITANDKNNSSFINNFYMDLANNSSIEAENITNNAYITAKDKLEFIFDNQLLNQGTIIAKQFKVTGGNNSNFINEHGSNVADLFSIDVNKWMNNTNSIVSNRASDSAVSGDNTISAKSIKFSDSSTLIGNKSNYIFNTDAIMFDKQSGLYMRDAKATFNSAANLIFAGGEHRFKQLIFNVVDTLNILNSAQIYFSDLLKSDSNRFVIDDAKVNYQEDKRPKTSSNNNGKIDISAKNAVDNNKGLLSGKDVSINSNSDKNQLTVNNNGEVIAINTVNITARNVNNSDEGRIYAKNIKISDTAKLGEVNNSGKIVAGENVEISTKNLNNRDNARIDGKDILINLDQDKGQLQNEGLIAASNNIEINTYGYNNTNQHEKDHGIVANNDATINIYNNDLKINGTDKQSAIAFGTLKYNVAGNMFVITDDKGKKTSGILNPGNVEINANNLTNDDVIYSQANIKINNRGKLLNQQDGEINAQKALNIQAKEVFNDIGSVIYSKGDMSIKTGSLTNNVAKIASDSKLTITTNDLNNLSQLGGELKQNSPAKTGDISHRRKGEASRTNTNRIFGFEFNSYRADDLMLTQGEITSKDDLTINLDQKGLNEGVISSLATLSLKGTSDQATFQNVSKSKTKTVEELLKSTGQITIQAEVKVAATPYRNSKSYNNLYEFFDYIFTNFDKQEKIKMSYHYTNRDFVTTLQSGASDAFANVAGLNEVLSKVFGADWKAVGNNVLRDRWNTFKNNSSAETYKINYYADKPTILAGEKGVDINIKNYIQGEYVSNEVVKGQTNEREYNVGDSSFTSLDGELDDAYKRSKNSTYNTSLQDYLDGKLASIDNIIKAGKLSIKNDLPKSYDYKDITFSPRDVNIADKNDKDQGILTKYLYETRIPYNPDNYYGSKKFFEELNMTTNGKEIYSIGDSYFEDNLIQEQYKALKGVNAYLDNSDESISKSLMINAKFAKNKLNLEIGKPLSQEQINGLTADIVWYEWAEASNGAYVLTPRVYLSNQSVEAKNSLGSGPMTASNGNVNIQSDNGSIVNNNGAIIGQNVNLDAGKEGSVYTAAKEGYRESISADKVTIKAGDITVKGNGVVADNIDLDATSNVNLITGMSFDKDGKVVKDGTTVLRTQNDDSSNSINIKGKDITLVGADIDAKSGSITLDASNDITMKNVYEVESSAHQDANFSALSYDITNEQSATATSVGSSLSSDKLTIKAGNNLTETGSGILANTSQVDVGNDFTSKAAENYDYYHMDNKSLSLFGVAATNKGYSNGRPGGENISAASKNTPDEAKMAGAGSAKTGFGIAASSTEYTKNSKKYSNSQLNLGNGTINVGNTFDFGGADLNTAHNTAESENKTDLTVNAGNITSTKYVDEESTEYKHKSFSFGLEQTASSSIAAIAVRSQNKEAIRDTDPGLAIAADVGDVTQLVFGSVGSVENFTGFRSKEEKTTTKSTSENANNIMGNISFNSKKDITLNNVNISNADNVKLEAKNDVNINAGKNTYEEGYKSISSEAGIYHTASVSPLGSGASAGIRANGTNTKSTTESTEYNNSSILAKNISIKSGNDLNIKGGNIAGDNVDIHADGDINISSIQNTKKVDGLTVNAGASLGVGVNTNTLVSPDVSITASRTKNTTDNHTVAKQSGIVGKSVNITGKNDLNLNGAHIVADNGSLHVDGDINATEIDDKIYEHEDKYGGSVGIDGTKTMPNATFSWGKGNNQDKQTTNHATISLGNNNENVTAGGTTNGSLNTDKDKLTTVTKDKKSTAIESDVTLGIPKSPFKKVMSNNAPKTPTKKQDPKLISSETQDPTTPTKKQDPKLTSTETQDPIPKPTPKRQTVYEADTEFKKFNNQKPDSSSGEFKHPIVLANASGKDGKGAPMTFKSAKEMKDFIEKNGVDYTLYRGGERNVKLLRVEAGNSKQYVMVTKLPNGQYIIDKVAPGSVDKQLKSSRDVINKNQTQHAPFGAENSKNEPFDSGTTSHNGSNTQRGSDSNSNDDSMTPPRSLSSGSETSQDVPVD